MEINMLVRLSQRYKLINVGKLVNYDFYHLEHYHPSVPRKSSTYRKVNSLSYKDKQTDIFHPNKDDWGLIKFPLEVQRGSSNRANREVSLVSWPWFELPAFIFLISAVTTQMACDRIILFLMGAYHLWCRRAQLVWEAATKEPVIMWPRLLLKLWRERSVRMLGQRN